MIKFDNDEFLKPQIYSTNDEYETRCNVTKEIVDDIKQLQQGIQELKKQQKEFIEWLENESREIYRDGGLRQNIFRQVLQKYKEIIGVKDEK